MEFKLNKIDTDIRKKLQEETKDDKVHCGKGINVNRDLNEQTKSESHKETENLTKEDDKKKYITIDGTMYTAKNINIKAEKITTITVENSKGRLLDTKK